MPTSLRIVIIILCAIVMVGALSQAPQVRQSGLGQKIVPQVERLAATVDGLLSGIVPGARALNNAAPTLPPLAASEDPPPARFIETSRNDLTDFRADFEYTPEPDQGTRQRTGAGTVWWGWAPEGEDPRPVVLLLHGAGRDGESMLDMWRETAEAERLILIAPDFAGIPGWDRGTPDQRYLTDVLEHAATLWPIDRDRIGMFGHSRGGIAVQLLANRIDGPWRAVVAHAGTVPMEAVQGVADGVPIRHYLGSQDRTFPFGPAITSGRAMAAAGHPFELVRLEGHTHWLYHAGEDIAADAWRWMAPHLR